MNFEDHIDPFSWHEHDNEASVTLYASDGYKKDLFKTRKKDGFRGTGYDWESLAQAFLNEVMPEIKESIKFDSENGMFCAYSSDLEALKTFAVSFKNACEDDALLHRVFSHAKPDTPPTAQDINDFLRNFMGK